MAQGLLGGFFGAQAPDPMQGMGLLGRLQHLQQNNPEALIALGSGMMQGNMGAGFAAAGDQMAIQREKMMEQQAQQQQQNKTKAWLVQNKGLSPEEADMAISNPQILGTYLKTGQGQGIINAGAGNLYDADKGVWLSAPGGGVDATAGLQPVWLRDENGQPVLGQMRKDGSVVRSQMPEGTSAIGPYDVNFDKALGTAAGKGAGEAAAAVPGATQIAENINQQVNDLKNDPYLPEMLGPVRSRLPNVTADAARVQSKIDQIKGGAFLNGRQALKGGGAITDFESQKAEAAYARLNEAQTMQDFTAALDEFNFYVQQGLAKLQAHAAQSRMGPGTFTAPAPAQGGDNDPLGIR